MKLFKYLAREAFLFIGAFVIGFFILPGSNFFIFSYIIDLIIFIPLGVILVYISFYYNFIDKS